MNGTGKMRSCRAVLLVGGASLTLFAGIACGGDDFANTPRPPVTVQISGAIQDDGVAISPDREGAGRIQLTISNLTDRAHSVTLEGEDVIEHVPQIQPQDTGTIRKTLRPGTYEIRAGSRKAVDIQDQIPPATLTIGPERASSDEDLLLP